MINTCIIHIKFKDDLQKYKNADVAKRETLFIISWVCGPVDRMKVGRKIHWFLVDS
jgi:hypothetical protein